MHFGNAYTQSKTKEADACNNTQYEQTRLGALNKVWAKFNCECVLVVFKVFKDSNRDKNVQMLLKA